MMKRALIIIVGVVVAAVLLVNLLIAIVSYRKHALIQREMSALRTTELPHYAGFLKPGMTRAAVEQELNRRSIYFGTARDSSNGSNLTIRIKQLPSSQWYCGTEDIGVKIIFLPENAPVAQITPQDPLLDLDVFDQLGICL
jgi:hypothetical protein